MCFDKLNIGDMPKVAEQDIPCYKFLKVEDGNIQSPFNYFIWSEGEIRTSILETEDYEDRVDEGLHAHKELQFSIQSRNFWEDSETTKIYNMVIPKGAMYLENKNEYVSDKMILKSATPVEEVAQIA